MSEFKAILDDSLPRFVWIDNPESIPLHRERDALEEAGFSCHEVSVGGRALGDQVWWKRHAIFGSRGFDLPDISSFFQEDQAV